MEQYQNRTKTDSSSDRAVIIARATLSAVRKLAAEKNNLNVEEISAMIQSDPSMAEILVPLSEWKKIQNDEIVRQKKEIESLKDKLQKNLTKRRAMIAQLDAAERQVSKIKDFMFRAFPVLIQHVNTGKNRQFRNALSRIRELLKKRAAVSELDDAFQQLKDCVFKNELDTQEEQASAAEIPMETTGRAFFKRPAGEGDSPLGRFRKKYRKMIDAIRFSLDKIALRDIAEIEERLRNALDTYDLLEVQKELRRLLKAFVHRAGLDRDQAAEFILEIGERLVEVEQQILFCTASLRETGEAGTRFTTEIEQEMTNMQGAVDVTKNLEELKSRVVGSIGIIKKAIENKRKQEWIQAQKADEEVSSLNKNIERMKLEIASAKKRTKRLETQVLVDPLTQIYNRRAYERRIEGELKRCRQDQFIFSILLLDVDRFKRINERYGHPVGDICLQGLASRIKPLLGKQDFMFRFEGDVFLVLLSGTSAQGAGKMAEKIRAHIEKTTFLHKKEQVRISISIGVAAVNPKEPSAEDLFGRAEKALYKAKAAGRNRVGVAPG